MTREEIRAMVVRLLSNIAPDVEIEEVDPSEDLREQMDIDSMDFLNFVIALGKELSTSVPEVDYPQLATLDRCVDYVASRLSE